MHALALPHSGSMTARKTSSTPLTLSLLSHLKDGAIKTCLSSVPAAGIPTSEFYMGE